MDLIQAVPRRLRRVQERFVEGNRVTLLRDAAEAFPAMLEAIGAARRQVLLEMYWFDSDRTGRMFAEALMEASSRGVEVAVLYDSLGSWEADPGMFEDMKRAGIHVIEFNPMMPWKKRFRLARLSLRDHRKILVVDGNKGFTGGINLADVWLPEEEEGQGWRDDMICVQGPAVAGLIDVFLRTWEREGGAPLRELAVASVGSAAVGDQRVHVLGENYVLRRREITSAYLLNIYRARSRVWIANSYFVPDRTVTRALKRAARRGVDVRVILPAFSDVEIVRHASRAMWGGLLRSGVRLFEFYRSILHAKSAVIDGTWSTIGSFNMDYRSLRANLEVNVAVQDAGFGAVMEQSFHKDLEHCREVDAHEFKFRPLGHRLLEVILYRFRKFL
jgi:cardiolipin synthase